MGNLKLGVSQNRLCDFLADPDSRIFSRFTLIFTGAGSYKSAISLPRQVRDNYRESTQEETRFLIDAAGGGRHDG